jgi:hypothetical protein
MSQLELILKCSKIFYTKHDLFNFQYGVTGCVQFYYVVST